MKRVPFSFAQSLHDYAKCQQSPNLRIKAPMIREACMTLATPEERSKSWDRQGRVAVGKMSIVPADSRPPRLSRQ